MSNIRKLLPILCCLLSVRLATGEKKINLEDIENENLANERQRQYKQNFVYVQPEAPVRYVTPAQPTKQPEIQYGFRPMKTQQEYQQQPVHENVDAVQYNPQQYSAQQYSEQLPNEQQYVIQAKPQVQQPESFYLNTNQLLQDNNVLQPYYHQQQQLVYLQPQTAATNTIQAVPDNKGGIQYVMYVPTPYVPEAKSEPSQEAPTVQDYVQQYPTQEGRSEQQIQYVEVPVSNPEVEYQQQNDKQSQVQYVPQQQIDKQHQVQYVTQQQNDKQNQVQYVTQQQIQIPQPVRFGQKSHLPRPKSSIRPFEVDRVPNYEYMAQKHNPKSLVDSYIPSALQLQYMKQLVHQQVKPVHDKTHGNLIGQHPKPRPPNAPKKGFIKNFVNDFIAAAQTHNYRYAPPSPQRYYIRQ